MPKPSKFKPSKVSKQKDRQPKRPASTIETIADVVSVARHDEEGISDDKRKPNKRAKTSHDFASIRETVTEAKIAVRRPSDADDTTTIPPTGAQRAKATPGASGSTYLTTDSSSSAPVVAPDSNPPDAYTVLPLQLANLLRSSYDVHALSISSSHKVTNRVKTVLDLLENGFDLSKSDQKPGVVALTAKSNAANKLITVVEIAKRELEKKKLRWFQYNGMGSWLGELKSSERGQNRKDRNPSVGGRRLDGKDAKDKQEEEDVDMEGTSAEPIALEDDSEDDEAFETMGDRNGEKRTKVRNVPVLTIYMSRVPVAKLKAEYG